MQRTVLTGTWLALRKQRGNRIAEPVSEPLWHDLSRNHIEEETSTLFVNFFFRFLMWFLHKECSEAASLKKNSAHKGTEWWKANNGRFAIAPQYTQNYVRSNCLKSIQTCVVLHPFAFFLPFTLIFRWFFSLKRRCEICTCPPPGHQKHCSDHCFLPKLSFLYNLTLRYKSML